MNHGRNTSKRLAAVVLGVLAIPAAAQADDLSVSANGRTITVSALTDQILRVRIAPTGHAAEDASWAVPAEFRAARAATTASGTTLTTAAVVATVDPATLALSISDRQGHVIVADSAEPLRAEGAGFALRKQFTIGEHVFGMGDKTGLLDRRGGSFVNWTTDQWGFQSSTDPVYKAIPFYISTGRAEGGSSRAYGLLLDNSFRSWFDFGHREADVLSFGAPAGPIDYYVIAGPSVGEVVRRYTDLTGKAPLPPRWVLGYQQSRWSYESEAEVRALAAKMRAVKMPIDVIWLDIDFQDRNRPFTFNTAAFPHFKGMVQDLKADGINIVTITDLHVAHAPGQGYAPYDSGSAGDHFLHRADGSTYVGPVWPGPAVFPEFTRPETRAWWGEQFRTLADAGVAGIWNDMNEPAIFEFPTKTMPDDVRHRIAGDGFAPRTATHAEIHNVYGMLNSRGTYDGLRSLRPDERAFVMTRASFAGGQRYSTTWTGDNTASWDHLKLAVAQTLNLGMSGFSWTGTDVGGFIGGPTPELMTRWFEYAAFAPIFRDHSAKDAPRAEPWVDGEEQLAIRRRYVEERYRLLPYLYQLAEANARTGDPLMRPVFYDYPAVLETPCNPAMTFTVGGRLLIAGDPKPEAARPYDACLPAGDWYDYWSGARIKTTPSADGRYGTLTLTPELAVLPAFVRAGTILPKAPLVESTAKRPQGPLELHVYPGPDCAGELYDDDGHSLGFTRGAVLRQTVRCTTDAAGAITAIRFEPRRGSYPAWWSAMAITIHGAPGLTAALGGQPLATTSDGGATRFTVPDQRGAAVITLSPHR